MNKIHSKIKFSIKLIFSFVLSYFLYSFQGATQIAAQQMITPLSGEGGEMILPETASNNSIWSIIISVSLVLFGFVIYRVKSLREKLSQYLDPVVQKLLCTFWPGHKKRLFENRLQSN